jgi:hypothetical protein
MDANEVVNYSAEFFISLEISGWTELIFKT